MGKAKRKLKRKNRRLRWLKREWRLEKRLGQHPQWYRDE